MRPHAQQAEIAGHAEQEQRHRKGHADPELARLIADLGLAGGALHILGGLAFAGHDHVIARVADRLLDRLQTDDARQVLDAGPLAGQVDVGRHDPIQPLQRALDGQGAVGAGHAGDRQLGLGRRHIIPDVPDQRKKLALIYRRRIIDHRRLFGGQVHRRFLDAVQALQVPLDGQRAVGAGHARDGQGYLFGCHLLPPAICQSCAG